MSEVNTLMNRTIDCIRSHGYDVWFVGHIHEGGGETPKKTIGVCETFRMNHRDQDNVTVTIDVTKWCGGFGHRIISVKVPKNASDRVINNRVEKIIEAYKNAE